MIKKEVNGKTYYCFEQSEEEARKRFERSMIGEETTAQMMTALLQSITEMERIKREAWASVQEAIPEELEDGIPLTYNWMMQGFMVEQKTSK